MDREKRRNFMVDEDVVPSKQPWWRVTGREWPAGLPQEEIIRALAETRYARDAQEAVWRTAWVRARSPHDIFDHVEVWERDGKVVLLTSHVYEGETKIEAAKAWADDYGVSFSHETPQASWHNHEPDRGCHLFIFARTK